jgi:hypothetical protein
MMTKKKKMKKKKKVFASIATLRDEAVRCDTSRHVARGALQHRGKGRPTRTSRRARGEKREKKSDFFDHYYFFLVALCGVQRSGRRESQEYLQQTTFKDDAEKNKVEVVFVFCFFRGSREHAQQEDAGECQCSA